MPQEKQSFNLNFIGSTYDNTSFFEGSSVNFAAFKLASG
jgi:hypothetical protein